MTTLKLEVGKSYRTRDGMKGYVKSFNHNPTDKWPWEILVDGDKFYSKGQLFGEHPLAIISEWQDEPESVTKTYSQEDISPLLAGLIAIEALSPETYTIVDIRNIARQALERFKGMNTLAPSKTD